MRVLITGATGFVGRALCLRLARDHHQVVAWCRDPAAARSVLGAEVEIVQAEAGGLSALFDAGASAPLDAIQPVIGGMNPPAGASAPRDAIQPVIGGMNPPAGASAPLDAIINLAGEPIIGKRWSAAQKERLVNSRIGLAKDLAAAVAGASRRPAVMISASATGYYGDRGDEILDEDSGGGAGFLAALCRDWEEAPRGVEGLGVRLVTLRIGVVLGPEGGALSQLLPIFDKGLGGPLAGGRAWWSWIHLRDLVELIAVALTDARYSGVVNAVAPGAVTNAELTRTLAEALGKSAPFPVPGFALKALFGEGSQPMLDSARVQPRRAEALGFPFAYPSLRPALDAAIGLERSVRFEAPSAVPDVPYLAARPPRYMLAAETWIDAPLSEVFAFFSRPENLGAITPPSLSFVIETPGPIEMKTGAAIDYTIRLGAVPMRWRTRIMRYEPGRGFADAQEEGPYRSWWHEHRFEEVSGTTRMEDRVYYAPPLGAVGAVAQAWFVRPMLERIFGYRAFAIQMRFGLKA